MPLRRRKWWRPKSALVKVGGRTRRIPTLEEQADEKCRQLVFLRDGYTCRRCRMPRQDIQWHHIVSRSKKAMKHDPANCLTLCSGCHLWWHQHATAQDLVNFLRGAVGEEAMERLFLRKRTRARAPDFKLVILWLDKARDAMLERVTHQPFPTDLPEEVRRV